MVFMVNIGSNGFKKEYIPFLFYKLISLFNLSKNKNENHYYGLKN